MKKTILKIDDLCCPTEEQIIRNRLKGMQGIETLEFDVINQRLQVEHEFDDPAPIQQAIKSVGMSSTIVSEEGDHIDDHAHRSTSLVEKILMGMSGLLAVGAEAVGWATGNERSWIVIALALLSIALGGRETLRKGIAAVRTFTLNINFLMSIAIVGAMCIGSWPEAAMVTFLFGVAEMVEAASMDRVRNAIRSLLELKPQTAFVQQVDGSWLEVAVSEIVVGSLIRVRPGDKIPLDGEVIFGSSTINQAPITGESMPVEKAIGDTVFAGTINERGSFEFRSTTTGADTTLARIIKAVEQAQSERAPTQRFIDRFARIYTPVVVLLALVIAVLPPVILKQPFEPWLYKALVLLVIACPCALVISTPVTIVSALAAAARSGILVKGGVYMEEGRKLTVLALDKTGTITHGQPKVTNIVPLGDSSEERLLQLAASLDAPSEHPVANAVVSAFKGEVLPVANFHSITGRGVQGEVNGDLYYLGNHRLAHEQSYCNPQVEEILNRLEEEGKTVVILGKGGSALGVLAVSDTIRETSVQAIKELHELGVKTLMLTGDNNRTAQAIAKQVGIDQANGDLLPEDKLKTIDALISAGDHIGMVGDGINDAPALAKSHIGFAMGVTGTDTAIETADIALMKDDLRKIPEFIRLSRRASTILKQNIAFAIGLKVLFFALAFMGIATLWMAVFADMGGSLLVVGNGLRLLRQKQS